MSHDTKTFHLPDLGEGLPDATIVEWFVKEGDIVKLDAPLVSMETAKAVVEVPSPFSGKVTKLHGKAGDVIDTGAALVDIELDPKLPQRAEAESTGHHHAPPKAAPPAKVSARRHRTMHARSSPRTMAARSPRRARRRAPMPAPWSARWKPATASSASRPSRSAASRPCLPCARWREKLGVDLSRVIPERRRRRRYVAGREECCGGGHGESGLLATPAGEVGARSATDQVRQRRNALDRRRLSAAAAPSPVGTRDSERTALSASGQPMRTSPPAQSAAFGQPEQVKGVRRNMARVMADAHAKVVPTTICDDADIHAWLPGNDITVRLIRALVSACKTVPALNAWFDGENLTRTLHPHVDIGIAVDTEDGLFVPALRNADVLDAAGVRVALNRIRDQVQNRSIPAEELKGYTISLSNFGVFAGRYATPIVVPPCVAIVAAGKLRHEVVAVMGAIETHRVMPLSLTFDHRAATGGEAARFLKAMLDDLALAR